MRLKGLFNILQKYDSNGNIINELITEKLLSIDDISNIAIESNNFDIMYYVSTNVDGVDIKKIEDKIYENGDIYNICKFAIAINSDINLLQEKIINSKNPKHISYFAKYMEKYGANIGKLENEIIKIADASSICDFGSEVKGADLNKLEDKIIEIGDPEYMSYFALSVSKKNGLNLDKLTNAIIKSNQPFWMRHFAYAIHSKEHTDKVLDAIIENCSWFDVYETYEVFRPRYALKFFNSILNSNVPDAIFNYIEKNISELDEIAIKKLIDKLIESSVECDEVYYLYWVSEIIDEKLSKKIENVLVNYKKGVYANGYFEKDKPKVLKRIFFKK